jgi:general secretion pathway protein H
MRPTFPARSASASLQSSHALRQAGVTPGSCPGARFAGNCAARAGFTLLEMVAVMLIVALVAGLVITLTPGTGRAQLKSTALDAVSLLRRERQGAILTGRDRQVALDGERRALVGDSGLSVPIPRDVVLNVLGADAQWLGRRALVSFRPDGASSGAVMTLSREGASYEIRVNWYTGGVALDER